MTSPSPDALRKIAEEALARRAKQERALHLESFHSWEVTDLERDLARAYLASSQLIVDLELILRAIYRGDLRPCGILGTWLSFRAGTPEAFTLPMEGDYVRLPLQDDHRRALSDPSR